MTDLQSARQSASQSGFIPTLTRPIDGVTIPLPFTSVTEFVARYDIDRSTLWRWVERGWLPKPTLIGGRAYLPTLAAAEFAERAATGAFAASNIFRRKPDKRTGSSEQGERAGPDRIVDDITRGQPTTSEDGAPQVGPATTQR